MKKMISRYLCCVFLLVLPLLNTAAAEENKKFSHVLMVWLNQPNNAQMRSKFIAASKQLNSFPGIINRHVGVVSPSDRGIVDDTFDVAVTITFNDKKAYEKYLADPKHKQIIESQLKPLVNRIVAYDFISE